MGASARVKVLLAREHGSVDSVPEFPNYDLWNCSSCHSGLWNATAPNNARPDWLGHELNSKPLREVNYRFSLGIKPNPDHPYDNLRTSGIITVSSSVLRTVPLPRLLTSPMTRLNRVRLPAREWYCWWQLPVPCWWLCIERLSRLLCHTLSICYIEHPEPCKNIYKRHTGIY